ncbi:MAG TPA: nucleotidyltransferase domain-containing protein [Thermoanaerobaculia bacterium]|nr:nucleotidyltransferase domain-containing protein [Thermoanaerobaculia bacterium]
MKSSTSSVLKWPRKTEVLAALERWARTLVDGQPEVVRAGYFGSLSRGDWGVGSDVDLVLVVETAARPPWQRPLDYDTAKLPVPADLLVFTRDEWDALASRDDRFAREMKHVVWVGERGSEIPPR